MQLFDLHADTLFRIYTENLSPLSTKLSVTPEKALFLEEYKQFLAVWIPDDIRGEKAFAFFKNCADIFKKYYEPLNNENRQFYLSVENGSVIGGDVSKISVLKEYGVKTLTLVYNEDNELGSGAFSHTRKGLTDTGVKAVKELENNNIFVDLSHSSLYTFYDVAKVSSKPMVATHSNSYKICPHKRNLTDEQFKIICQSGGVVGVNFYPPFLNEKANEAKVDDVIKHIYHFLSLGGEDHICVGSDFDGCEPLCEPDSIEKMPFLYDSMLKLGFNEQLIQKILYYNAHNFFS